MALLKRDRTVVMDREEWERLVRVWDLLMTITSSMPFTREDCMEPEEKVEYHRVVDFMNEEPYDPANWGDEDTESAETATEMEHQGGLPQ